MNQELFSRLMQVLQQGPSQELQHGQQQHHHQHQHQHQQQQQQLDMLEQKVKKFIPASPASNTGTNEEAKPEPHAGLIELLRKASSSSSASTTNAKVKAEHDNNTKVESEPSTATHSPNLSSSKEAAFYISNCNNGRAQYEGVKHETVAQHQKGETTLRNEKVTSAAPSISNSTSSDSPLKTFEEWMKQRQAPQAQTKQSTKELMPSLRTSVKESRESDSSSQSQSEANTQQDASAMRRTVVLRDSSYGKVTRSAEDRGQKISQLSQEPSLQQFQQQQQQQQHLQMHPQMLVAQGLWSSHQQQSASQMQDRQPGQMQNSQQVFFAAPMPGMMALNGQATHAIGNWFPGGIMMHPGFLSQPTKSNAGIDESNESLALGMYLSQVQQQPQQQQQQQQSTSLNQAQMQLLQANSHMAQGKSLSDLPRFIPAPQPPLELLGSERAPSMHVRHNTPLPPRWLNVEVLVAFSVDYSKSTPDNFVFTSDIIEKGFLFHFMKRTKFHSLTPKQYRAAVRKLVSDCRPGYSNEDRESLPKELLARLRDHVEFVGRSHWGFKRFVVIGPDCAKFRVEQQIVERNAANFSPVVRSMLESSREPDAQTFGGSFLSAPRENQQMTSSAAPFAQTATPNFLGQQRMISTPSVSLDLSETKKRKDSSRDEHTENEGGNERFAAHKMRKIECNGPTP